jgi:C-terminal processing protease CtpA/Prc
MRRILTVAALVCCCFAQQPSGDKVRHERLAALGKLWTFVKYFHPRVASEQIDWDAALLTAIDKTNAAKTEDDFVAAAGGMLDALHDPATHVLTTDKSAQSPDDAPGPANAKPGDNGILVVRIRDGNYMTTMQAVNQMAPQFASATAIVFDLRGSHMTGSFLHALPVSRPIAGPGFFSRSHSGYPSPDGSGSGGYFSQMAIREGLQVLPGKDKKDVPAVFLVDKNTSIPPLALALQNAGTGAIVSEDPIDDSQADVTEYVPLVGNRMAAMRIKDLYYSDGTTGLGANRVLNVRGEPALQVAIEMARAGKWDQPAMRQKAELGKSWIADKPYAEMEYPELGYRELAAIRIWGVYNYFHPYKYLSGEDWDAVLLESLPKMAHAANAREYHLAVAEMVSHSHDTHCFVSSQELRNFYGVAPPAFEIRWIEERPVIVHLANEAEAKQAGVQLGDVIVRIKGQPVRNRIDELSRYIAASTPQSLMSRVMQNLLNGDDGTEVDVTVAGADGKERPVRVKRQSANYKLLYPHRSGEIFWLINDEIGYVDLERLPPGQVSAMFEKFKQTKAIVMDMRGYPQGTAWAIAPRLGEKTSPVAAQFRTNVVSAESTEGGHVNSMVFEQRIPAGNNWRYLGKTAMLIDERAISQSEHSGLFYKTANDTVFIGGPTTGANGDVTWFAVPGGIRINFSGHDVRWPDGKQLQRVGLKPDVEVLPTIAGIRAGRDEVLEKAVEYLSQKR